MIRSRIFYCLASILVLMLSACSIVNPQGQTATPAQSPLASPGAIEGVLSPTETTIPATKPVEPEPTGSLTPTATRIENLPEIPANVYGPVFAEYSVAAVNLPTRYKGGYTLPIDLNTVRGLDIVAEQRSKPFSKEQQKLLSQNGFVVLMPVPGKYQEFYQVYEMQRYMLDQPLFITTDAVFHIYHLLFDKLLRDLEREQFSLDLKNLTSALLNASHEQYQTLKGTLLEEPARRNVAYFAIGAQLLGLPDPIPAEANDLVAAELAFINAHTGAHISPIWDRADLPDDKKLIEDYSQYVPRGHYTRDEALQRYFRAMMWYGRLTFRARDEFETRRALLLVSAMRQATSTDGAPAVDVWQDLYQPINFIVGKADDLSYFEYSNLMDLVYGANAKPAALQDDGKLAQFLELVRKLPAPQVNSMWVWIWEDKKEATQGFRFMGQRFTLDAYVFGQLIWRNVGTPENLRTLPKGLDFFAAVGSEESLNILKSMGENQYQNYDQQMNKVRQEIKNLALDSWTQNLYWAWLYAFQPLLPEKDAKYPAFMQTQAWTRKELNTSLGSWTELKHDTLLYAKQVMAEMGGGGADEPPHGYIEPNPEVYSRLLALAQMTRDGLDLRGLLNDRMRSSLENLIDLLSFLKTSSERLLAGETLSDDDYWRIQYFGGELEALTLSASDCSEGDVGMCRDLSDQKAALVADVATGFTPDGNLVALEEGVGQPTEIYVILPDQPWRIGVGAVYTYYEFTVPADQRMTDEQWQALVEKGKTPTLPEWTKIFMVP